MSQSNDRQGREQWGSRMGFMLAAAGSAVGLGNIWRFPYITGKNGGAAFLIIYLVMVFCIGASVMLAEFAIGRASKRNSVGAFRKLKGGAEDVQNIFLTFIANPPQVLLAFFAFMAMVVVVVYRGVGEGIEKYCKVLMPGLFVILVILMVRALTLPGAMEGVSFYLKPDFSKVTGATVIDALGQAFYSLSLGMGILITYGSYISNDEDLPRSVATVTLLDTMVAVLSGLVIFPTVFAFGVDAGAGPGLSFIALPAVFSKMWGGPVWSALFFTLLFIAALTSSVSLFEVVISYCMDELKWTREK
ncbi:neurotransmitter:Na+ symporter, NSS family [Dethiosulfovibrio salsuginis]|uniref:Transporter n=1 Tax=Dethiosulfovibrio salsuginis TaxID=561720 RepID=A0A1X7KYJ6_9BACT|nr:neurotransmitter:Na+ symporter, NSS family [Dethiosulfovibrio salsuginis]